MFQTNNLDTLASALPILWRLTSFSKPNVWITKYLDKQVFSYEDWCQNTPSLLNNLDKWGAAVPYLCMKFPCLLKDYYYKLYIR